LGKRREDNKEKRMSVEEAQKLEPALRSKGVFREGVFVCFCERVEGEREERRAPCLPRWHCQRMAG
jgi:hypothetical protein